MMEREAGISDRIEGQEGGHPWRQRLQIAGRGTGRRGVVSRGKEEVWIVRRATGCSLGRWRFRWMVR